MLHGLSAAFLYSALSISFVFEGGQEVPGGGTGFFVRTGSRPPCFITNKHVITGVEKRGKEKKLGKIQRIIIKGKSSSGEPQYNGDFVFDAHKWNIVFPKNNDDDVAVLCGIRGRQEGRPVSIEREMLATESYFEDDGNLGVYDYVAVPGFHPGYDPTTNRPIFRGGNISSDPRYGHSARIDGGPYKYYKNLILYETFAYPGSSGSPVFALQKGIKTGGGMSSPAYRPAKLIGIQSMMKYANPVKEGEVGVHSGLSYFFKSSAILEILDSIPKG